VPFRPFPSIEQFRHCVADVTHRARYVGRDSEGQPLYDAALPLPSLVFEGTVKLHGTNSAVRLEPTASGWRLVPQSRQRDISVEDDNAGFAAWVQAHEADLAPLLVELAEVAAHGIADVRSVTFFGEWVGQRVNGKTGIGRLSERWVLFNVAVDTEEEAFWPELLDVRARSTFDLARANAFGLFFIKDFKTWQVAIDFNHPEAALEVLEGLTLDVEALCPVAAAMGSEGIGEGIVWTIKTEGYGHLRFKTKGLKHKGTKSARLVEVAPEVMASRQAFVDAVVTESRLEQGLAYLVEQGLSVSRDNIGAYLQWFGGDVLKEESDTMKASGLEKQDVMKSVSNAAKAWFLARVNPMAV